ncbi:hypothetical protein [Pedobacter mendelii]|uniref:DUF4369 domain-containing protein n=1 Tax=Pedobacter mendelii TaxID=1908240 RepID=A0ABQ2BCZ7_9SPHI|nr:hypothetical protein [Pedobacter mendelii]GGI23095.1 hypothetical protein GCM10008119_05950 [Pedobacter mendelii]
MKIFSFFTAFFLFSIFSVDAQDFIVKNNDDVIRGTIKGTDYFSVFISANDQTDVILPARDVKNFFWNGNSYLSKGFATGKNLEYRFVKLIEMGAVNLYSFGGETLMPPVKQKNVRFRPSIGIGTGTGGYGSGMGLGGGLSIGGGRNTPDRPAGAPVVRYFIEKPGAGPLQEIPIKAITNDIKKAEVKTILLQKLGDEPSIKSQIEANTALNSNDVSNMVKAYNAAKK